jgi:hypothetical protein
MGVRCTGLGKNGVRRYWLQERAAMALQTFFGNLQALLAADSQARLLHKGRNKELAIIAVCYHCSRQDLR